MRIFPVLSVHQHFQVDPTQGILKTYSYELNKLYKKTRKLLIFGLESMIRESEKIHYPHTNHCFY